MADQPQNQMWSCLSTPSMDAVDTGNSSVECVTLPLLLCLNQFTVARQHSREHISVQRCQPRLVQPFGGHALNIKPAPTQVSVTSPGDLVASMALKTDPAISCTSNHEACMHGQHA